MPREELEFLNASGFSFVSVGRRDDAGGPVPYVAADYASIVRELISCARALGHTRFAYAGHGEGVESYTDRMAGARSELGDGFLHLVPGPEASPREWIRRIAAEGVTVVLAEQEEQFVLLQEAAEAEGWRCRATCRWCRSPDRPTAPAGRPASSCPGATWAAAPCRSSSRATPRDGSSSSSAARSSTAPPGRSPGLTAQP